MQTYPLLVNVTARTEAEAKAKLELILQIGAFLSDFDINELGASIIKYSIASILSKKYVEQQQKKEKIDLVSLAEKFSLIKK